MERHVRELAAVLAQTLTFPEPIWEIGSYLVPGQEQLANLRELFAGKVFVGVDMRSGPGVDRIENVEHIQAADASVGSVLCLNTFEHVQDFFAGMREIHRVLKPEGLLVMTTPFEFPIHDYPGDYWRFTPQALGYLTQTFPTRLVGTLGYAQQPHITLVVAYKQDCRDRVQTQLPSLKQKLQQGITRRRPHVDRRLRLALARWLAGEKFFRCYDHFYDVDLWLENGARPASAVKREGR